MGLAGLYGGRRAFLTLIAAVAIATGACAGPHAGAGTHADGTAAAGVIRGVSPSPAQDSTALRVMSFNIRYGTAADGDHAWPLRRHLTFRAIREFAPDVLGVQEALRFQLDEIARELPHYREIGVGRDDGIERGEYSAILYDPGRVDLLEHGTFWLSDTPDLPGSMSWGNRITRIATWGRFRDRVADATFYVFNTHWDHESQPSRERSATLLLERIRVRPATSDAVIVTGDFNAGEENEAFRALLRAGGAARLYDTFRAVHPDATQTGTFNAFRGERDGPKIDAILASPHWQTLDAGIVLLMENGLYPSDHFPVTATVVLRRDRP